MIGMSGIAGRENRKERIPKGCLEREFLEELQASINVCEPLDSYLFDGNSSQTRFHCDIPLHT